MNSFYSNCPSFFAEVQLVWLRQSSHKVPTAAPKYTESPKKQPKHSHNCGNDPIVIKRTTCCKAHAVQPYSLSRLCSREGFLHSKKALLSQPACPDIAIMTHSVSIENKIPFHTRLPHHRGRLPAVAYGLRLLRIRRGQKFVCTAMWIRRFKNRIAILVECLFALFRTPIHNVTSHPCL